MRDDLIARRALLRLLAAGIALRWTHAVAKTPPRGRHGPHPRHLPIVAIDPGHGGGDPGTISPAGIYEKRITLATAVEVARLLTLTGRFRAVLTRRRDRLIPLRQRVARARAQHAELLLSLHADALPDSAMRGLSVYTLSEQASDRQTAALAARENRDDFVGGVRLSRQPAEIGNILFDLARRETDNRSLAFADAILSELGRTVPLLEKPRRSAGFAVLTAPDVPSVLVELGCLSNPEEERLLAQRAYRRRLAQGLVRAIEDYFAAYR